MNKTLLPVLFAIVAPFLTTAPEDRSATLEITDAIAYAHTVSESAAIGPGRIDPQVRDHFGNLTSVQYIIAVPPTHA